LSTEIINNYHSFSSIPLKRIKSVDAVRGFATIEMVIYHFVTWYLPQLPFYESVRFIVITIFGLTLRFCFITVPAMSVSLQLYISKQKGIDENIIRNNIIKRGLLLIIIQFFCNFFGLLFPGYIWNSFILSFIGISIIFSYYVSKLSKKNRVILIIIILLITPFLKFHFSYLFFKIGFIPAIWEFDTFFYNMFLQVDFPILPYIAFSIFGTLYTEYMIDCIKTNNKAKFVKHSLMYGIISLVAYAILNNFRSILNYPDFFMNRPTRLDILFCIGSLMSFIGLFFWLQDWKQLNIPAFKIFEIFGLISLTTFITHYYFFQKIMAYIYPEPWANLNIYTVFQLFLIVIILHSIYGVINIRTKRKYSFEGFIRSCI